MKYIFYGSMLFFLSSMLIGRYGNVKHSPFLLISTVSRSGEEPATRKKVNPASFGRTRKTRSETSSKKEASTI